jgi:hypothetical protein
MLKSYFFILYYSSILEYVLKYVLNYLYLFNCKFVSFITDYSLSMRVIVLPARQIVVSVVT